MDNDSIWIESTRGPDDEPVCRIWWGPLELYANVDAVRETAKDLMLCAVYANMMEKLHAVGMPQDVIMKIMALLDTERDKKYFGHLNTITMDPVVHKNGFGLVRLRRGSTSAAIDPLAAEKMAMQWLTVAEGTEMDQLLSEAIRTTKAMNPETEAMMFGYLRELRTNHKENA